MPDLLALQSLLIEAVNDARTPLGMRQDAQLLLESLQQSLPLPPSGPAVDPLAPLKARVAQGAGGTWMGDQGSLLPPAAATPAGPATGEAASGHPQGLIPVAAPIKRSEMQPLPGQFTDNAVQLEVILRDFLGGEQLLAALVQQMAGVQEANDLGKALHARLRELVAWYVTLRGRVVGG